MSCDEAKDLPLYRILFEAVGGGGWSLDIDSPHGDRSLGNVAHGEVVDLRRGGRMFNTLLARGSNSCWVEPPALDRFYLLWRTRGRELRTAVDVQSRGTFECFIAVRPDLLCSYSFNACLRRCPLRLRLPSNLLTL